jgi:excisionase family DNA binding protein
MTTEQRSVTDDIVPKLLSVAEVAEILGMHHETVYRAVWDGKLRSVRIGRCLRVKVSDLRHYMDSLPDGLPRRVTRSRRRASPG